MATVGVAWDCIFNAVPLFVSRQTSTYITFYIVIYIMENYRFFSYLYFPAHRYHMKVCPLPL